MPPKAVVSGVTATPAGQGERCAPAPPAMAASGSAAAGETLFSCPRVAEGLEPGGLPCSGMRSGSARPAAPAAPLPGLV